MASPPTSHLGSGCDLATELGLLSSLQRIKCPQTPAFPWHPGAQVLWDPESRENGGWEEEEEGSLWDLSSLHHLLLLQELVQVLGALRQLLGISERQCPLQEKGKC